MSEYQIKFRVYTGSFLPPYYFDGIEFYQADSAKEAFAAAKADYRQKFDSDAEDYPMEVREVTKL